MAEVASGGDLLAKSLRISPHLPMSPHVSSYLPAGYVFRLSVSPRTASLRLSPSLPTSPHISPHLPRILARDAAPRLGDGRAAPLRPLLLHPRARGDLLTSPHISPYLPISPNPALEAIDGVFHRLVSDLMQGVTDLQPRSPPISRRWLSLSRCRPSSAGSVTPRSGGFSGKTSML